MIISTLLHMSMIIINRKTTPLTNKDNGRIESHVINAKSIKRGILK